MNIAADGSKVVTPKPVKAKKASYASSNEGSDDGSDNDDDDGNENDSDAMSVDSDGDSNSNDNGNQPVGNAQKPVSETVVELKLKLNIYNKMLVWQKLFIRAQYLAISGF